MYNLFQFLPVTSFDFMRHFTKSTDLFSYLYEHAAVIHSFSSLSYDRSKASSKASSPHSAIQSFFFAAVKLL